MEHPNKDVAYVLSYPRSGMTWFRHCLKFITNADTDPQLFYDTHYIVDDRWNLENCFDVKNILLLRNYKEAIFSEIKNTYSHSEENLREVVPRFLGVDYTPESARWMILCYTYIEVLKHIATEFNPELRLLPDRGLNLATSSDTDNPAIKMLLAPLPKSETEIIDVFSTLEANQIFNDFMLPGFPTLENRSTRRLRNYPLEAPLSFSIVNHYHFALQLKRYYDLLEYHDKVSKTNPSNVLAIRYEDLMQDPFSELNKVIDFIEETSLATSVQINYFKDNLHKLIDNIEHHRQMVATFATGEKHRGTPLSYKEDNKYNIHSSQCRKQFLVEIDNVLKNKNLELFNKYLSDYEEKED